MKKETIKKIEEEITKQTTMPENLKNEVRKDIFKNLLLGIAIMIYFIVLIVGNMGGIKDIVTVYFNIYSIFLLIFSIVLIEVAYKKNNGKTAVYGVEIMIVAILTMFLPYVIFEFSKRYQKYFILSTSLVSVYYIIKCIALKNKAMSVYEKEESDIDEITKAQKSNDDLLDEEMDIDKLVRRLQPNYKKEEKVADKKVATKSTKTATTKKGVKSTKTPAKKTTSTTKKVATKKAEEPKTAKSTTKKTTTTAKKKTTASTPKTKSETKKEEPKKGRGRPKKVEATEPKKEENAPKKRGRPRKVVNS